MLQKHRGGTKISEVMEMMWSVIKNMYGEKNRRKIFYHSR